MAEYDKRTLRLQESIWKFALRVKFVMNIAKASNVINKSNIILVGMPGSGKSTVGIILAKLASRDFVDTDVLIQVSQGRPLQDIVDLEGHMALRKIEEAVLISLDCRNCVIATGGSAAYSDAAMKHLKSEGVVFNSLEQVADEHLGRMLVLRPRLNKDERIKCLTTVFLLLGNGYDFKFDFNDSSYQCCTEVIYRALNEVGSVRFSLTRRMGKETLSADDIIHSYLTTGKNSFDFVLLAEKDLNAENHRALILTGKKGKERLISLMKE
jgi:shikimate kinase